MLHIKETARRDGFVQTLLGRRRHIPELHASNPSLRGAGERMAINMPIQGTAADIVKIAMIRLDERLAAEGFRARPLLQVHDELLLEVPRDEVDRLVPVLREVMEHALPLDVPLTVDIKVGDDWESMTPADPARRRPRGARRGRGVGACRASTCRRGVSSARVDVAGGDPAACRRRWSTPSRPTAASGTPATTTRSRPRSWPGPSRSGRWRCASTSATSRSCADLPAIRYLHLRSDGSPPLDPVAALPGLRALIIETRAQRGTIDLTIFPELRWLRVGLGGKGGAAMQPMIEAGLPSLEWLAVSETKAKRVTDLVAHFPALRSLRFGYADFLREVGPLAATSPHLTSLSLPMTGIRTLEGIGDLAELQTLNIFAGKADDLGPLRLLHQLRYARLLLSRVPSIEPLRGHPSLRMMELVMAAEPARDVLDSIPGLVAIGHGKGFKQKVPWPDGLDAPAGHPLRVEWFRAVRE